MAMKSTATDNLKMSSRANRIAVAACAAFGVWLLAACSPSDSKTTRTVGPDDVEAVTGANPPIPTTDSDSVYPAPDAGSSEGTAVSKAVTPPSGTAPVFLPAIINEKPPLYPFEVQQTGVLAVQGFSGCNWSAVAGQIFDQAGTPLRNLILHLEGFWNGSAVSAEQLSGSADQYGPAGYEFVLGNQTADSSQTLWIQVQDAAHKQISARVYFDTYNDCARNLILANFVQVR
jgi:hypothetical protein